MWEDPLGSVQAGIKDNYSGSTTRETMINQTLGIVESLNKQLMFVVNTNAGSNCGTGGGSLDFCFKNTNRERELAFQRYYLAGYLNFFRGSKTFLTYYTPTESGPQFNSEAFFRDWNTKIGQPLGTNQEVAPGVYRRIFQNAQVYWNNSTVDHRINFGGPVYTLDGEQVVNYTLKAKSGMIFTTSNPGPTPTPTPTPTPSPTATPDQTTCTPAGQSVLVNEQVTLATNRINNVSWDAAGATPSTGTGQTFTTKYSQPGNYEVIAVRQSDSSQVAVCKVSVKSPTPSASPSPSPTPNPSPSPSPSPSPTPSPTPSPSTLVIPVNEVSRLELTTAGYIGKFFSSKQNEFEFLISRGWTKLSTVFRGPAASVPGATMAIRFMQNDDANLTQTLTWAASEEDINNFLSRGFSQSQDADFYVYLTEQPGTVPVTRMKLNHQNKTFYTFSTSPEETENLISQGWEIQKEKIFFVYP